MTLTGYCDASGMPPYGITANMVETQWGIVACGPAFPFGTQFAIEDMNTIFVCEDRGGGITDDRLDIWFQTCWLARLFGVRKRWVEAYILVAYRVEPRMRRRR